MPGTSSAPSPKNRFKASLLPGLGFGLVMVLVWLSEILSQGEWARFGLHPRDSDRIWGVLVFPFLHGDFFHLAANLFPFVLLTTLIYNLVPRDFWKVFGFIFLLSGFWTWCLARPGTVIGASAWVYAELGLLWIAGFARLGRKAMLLTGGLAFLYAGMVEGILPVRSGISWEGHLMGFLSGALAAFIWRREIKAAAGTPDKKPELLAEEEAPYPYWLYPVAPVLDENRKIIHPEDLIWENGRPRRKPLPEENQNPDPSGTPESPGPPKPEKGFSDGYWTWTISR
jgi:membrane associated rhomboid family serine protease